MSATTTKRKKRFPKKELNAWVRSRASWSHADCEALLSDLTSQGFEEWTETADGRDEIGAHLEMKRANA